MANKLMFEVGIKRADNEYQRIYDEVMKLAQLGSKPIDLKVNFQSTRDLETFVNALKMVGDGKLLEPLLHKIEQLQVSMVKLGMIPKDINYKALEESLNKISKLYDNFQANLSKFGETHAVTTTSKGVWQKEVDALQKSFEMTEPVAREALHTWKNFGDTIAASMERVGGSKAGMETLAIEVNSVKVTVDNLVNSFSNLVREITNLGNANGKGVKETQLSLEGVDKETKTLAKALTKAIQELSEKKEAAASGEKDLGAQTEITTNHLAAERAQALSTAEALNQLANHLTVAAIASKNLFTIMGGNNSDVTKFIELATQMDALSRKASYVLSSDASAFKGGKMGAFAEVKKEMDEVSAKMDELKKNAAVGNPLVESFANAFNQLRETLEKANTAMSSAAASAKKLDNSVGGSKSGAEKLSAKFKSDDIEKLIKSINTLNDAAKLLKQTLGTLSKNASTKSVSEVAESTKAGAEAIQKQTQKFGELHDVIDNIISEINRLNKAFTQLGDNSSLSNLTAIIRNLEVTLGGLNSAFKFTASKDELAAYEGKVKSLQDTIATLEEKVKSLGNTQAKLNSEFKTVGEKAGSEVAQNQNLDTLHAHMQKVYEALTKMGVEYSKLEAAGIKDEGTTKRIENLRQYYEWLQKVEKMDLSKVGVLKSDATKFNGELLMGQVNKQMYSSAAIKEFQQMVEELLRCKEAADILNETIGKMKSNMLGIGTSAEGGMKGMSSSMETITKIGELNIQTLIKQRGHIERLIEIAQKSITFAEGHPVLGMDSKEQQQRQNLQYLTNVRDMIDHILENRNTPEWMRFLNTSSSLRIPLPGSDNDIALLGGHFNILTHSVVNTSQAIRQLKRDMSLDSDKGIQNSIKEQERAAKNAERENKVWANSMDFAKTKANELTIEIKRLQEAEERASKQGIDTSHLKNQIDVLRQNLSSLYAMMGGAKMGGTSQDFVHSSAFKVPLQTAKELKRIIDDASKTSAQKDDALVRFFERMAKSANDAGIAVSNLQKMYERFNNSKSYGKAEKLGIDTSSYKNALDTLLRYQNVLRYIRESGGTHDASRITGSAGYKEMLNNLEIQLRQLRLKVAETEKANAANMQLSESEQRLANAISHSTESMKGQSQVLSDLKMMAMQYLSVWGAQSFVNSIIETGGLLEQQRLSIGAILGDIEQANTLFGQIQQLALKSPFGVVELDKFSKQLTAFGFEYSELYDWTKRLGDISAATGTDVSRLALALGHVRSEGALSGYTLRQFAMANVPVLRMLSENMGISTKEVRERVRKKEISFDDVKDVLEELTNEGGMFYNAQEVMSQALNAKYKNLRDAFDIMYGQIAEGGVGDALKRLAETLTDMTRHWERIAKDVGYAAAAFGLYRTALYLTNTAVGANTIASLKNIKTVIDQENAHLRLARAANLVTKEEYKSLVTKGAYSASLLKVAITEKKLTIEELQRAVALGKVDQATAVAAVTQAGYDAKLISGIKVLNGVKKASFLAGEGVRFLVASFKSLMATLWPLLAFSAIFELFNRSSEQSDQAEEAAQSAAKSTNKYQELIAMTERMKDAEGQKDEQLKEGIKQMEEALKGVGRFTEELKKQVDEVSNLADKYEILRAAMKDVADEAEDKQSRKEALLSEAFGVGGGLFTDNALKDAKDIDEYATNLSLVLDKNSRVIRGYIKKYLSEIGEWKETYGAKSAKDLFMSLSDSQKDDMLYKMHWMKSTSEEKAAASAVADVLYGGSSRNADHVGKRSYLGAIEELKGHKDKIAELFADAFNVDYPEIDLTKADEDQKILFEKWLKETLSNINDLKEAGRKAFEDIVIEGTIEMRVDYKVEDNLDEVLKSQKEENPLLYGYVYKKHIPGMTADAAKEKWDEGKRLFGDYSSNNVSSISKGISDKINDNKKNIKANKLLVKSSDASVESKKEALDAIKKDEEENKKLMDYLKYTGQKYEPEKTKGGSEDKVAKALRERVRILKEAESAYQYWRKAVGDKASASHVNEEFGETLSKQGFSFKDITQYKKTLEDLKAEYQKIYDASKKGGKDRPQLLEAIKEVDKVLADIGRKDFEKSTNDFVSSMTEDIDKITRKWETFNSVVSSTGDRMLAARLSGISPGATPADLKRANVSSFAGVSIDFDRVLNMSGEEIDQYVYGLGVAEGKIKAVQNGLKDWKKAQEDLTKSDIQNYAKWLGSLVDLQSIQTRNQNEYNNTLDETNRLLKDGLITEEEANRRRKAAKYEQTRRDWESSSMYSRLYNNSQVMAKGEFAVAYQNELVHLKMQLENGTLTVEQYADKVGKLNDIMRSFSTTGFLGIRGGMGALLSGGYQGLIDYHKGRANDLRKQGRNDEADAEEAQAISMTKAKNAADQITKAFQDVASGADMLSNMFKALGDEGTANFFSDAGGVLSGVAGGAQALSGLGPWGMAAGAAIGGITSFAQLHDKHNQRLIEALQDDVKALEANTEMLKTSRSRTLGYDNGEIRKQMGEMYSRYNVHVDLYGGYDINTKYGSAGKAMAEFYGKGGNGYAKEFENLKKQRQDYIDMYNAERDKKDYSYAALEEYKQKIAELDDQIINFTEDLAKELWSIDIKGWGEQISDAIWTAFENGEDAAKGFHDTVKDIVADVAKKMMKLSVIEPMFQRLQKALFGEYDSDNMRYKNGAIKYDSNGNIDMANSEEDVLRILGQYFGTGGELEKSVEASEAFYEWVKKITGIDFSDKESGLAGSTAIKGVTEQSFDLGLSYINSIRADVSINRAKIAEYFPMFYQALTSSDTRLKNIEKSADAIMRSNDTIRDTLEDLFDDIHGLRTDAWRMPMQ